MKNSFRKFVVTAAVMAAAAMVIAAGIGSPQVVVDGASGYGIAGAGTTNFNKVVDVSAGKDVCFAFKFKLDGAGTDNVTVALESSGDNSSWVAFANFGKAANGTTEVVMTTNYSKGALPYLRVKSIANGVAAQSVTNYSIRVNVL